MALLAMDDQKKRVVEVNRQKLIETLKSNREKHAREYIEAVEGYKEMATKKFQEGYEQAKIKIEKNLAKGLASIDEFSVDNPRKSSDYLVLVDSISVELKVPRNFTSEYDAAIDMATWDVRETLELSHPEFQCFVRDVWDWSNDFRSTNMTYSKAAIAALK